MIHTFNSSIWYTKADGSSPVYRMWVTEYSQPHTLSGSSSQSKLFKHFYPRSYSPGAISVRGRVPTQVDYDNMARFIRDYHLFLMNLPGLSNAGTNQLPLMKLWIGEEGLNIQGVITNFTAGAKRFAVAPEYQFDFMVIKDAHSLNTDMHPAYAVRTMWTGTFIDEGAINFNSEIIGMGTPSNQPHDLPLP